MANNTLALANNARTIDVSSLKNKKLIEQTIAIQTAYEAIDTSTGYLALAMYRAQCLFKNLDRDESIDGLHNYAEYCEKILGVGRAQAFNIAKAGSMIKLIPFETKDGKIYHKPIDRFTCKAIGLTQVKTPYDDSIMTDVTPFSNTALLTISRLIADYDKNNNEKGGEDFVINLIKTGKITADMSIKKIEKAYESATKGLTVKTDKESDNTPNETDNDNDNDTDNDNSTDNDNTPNVPPTTFTMTLHMNQRDRFTDDLLKLVKEHFKDVDDFNAQYPAIYEVFTEMAKAAKV